MENVIRLHRPTLTAEEHTKRLVSIKKAAENLVVATLKNQYINRKETQK